MTKEKLQLNRKFLVIESPIPFEIYCPEQDDGVKRRQGSWQMTIHDLLTKSHYPLNPIYNLELIYDETLLGDTDRVTWYTTDLNLGEALRGIDGQLVTWNFEEQLNVNDFQYNNGLKNTRRKHFDDSLLFYNYLSNINKGKYLTNCSFYFFSQSKPATPIEKIICNLNLGFLNIIGYSDGNITDNKIYKVSVVEIFPTNSGDYKALRVRFLCNDEENNFQIILKTLQIEDTPKKTYTLNGFFEFI